MPDQCAWCSYPEVTFCRRAKTVFYFFTKQNRKSEQKFPQLLNWINRHKHTHSQSRTQSRSSRSLNIQHIFGSATGWRMNIRVWMMMMSRLWPWTKRLNVWMSIKVNAGRGRRRRAREWDLRYVALSRSIPRKIGESSFIVYSTHNHRQRQTSDGTFGMMENS